MSNLKVFAILDNWSFGSPAGWLSRKAYTNTSPYIIYMDEKLLLLQSYQGGCKENFPGYDLPWDMYWCECSDSRSEILPSPSVLALKTIHSDQDNMLIYNDRIDNTAHRPTTAKITMYYIALSVYLLINLFNSSIPFFYFIYLCIYLFWQECHDMGFFTDNFFPQQNFNPKKC